MKKIVLALFSTLPLTACGHITVVTPSDPPKNLFAEWRNDNGRMFNFTSGQFDTPFVLYFRETYTSYGPCYVDMLFRGNQDAGYYDIYTNTQDACNLLSDAPGTEQGRYTQTYQHLTLYEDSPEQDVTVLTRVR